MSGSGLEAMDLKKVKIHIGERSGRRVSRAMRSERRPRIMCEADVGIEGCGVSTRVSSSVVHNSVDEGEIPITHGLNLSGSLHGQLFVLLLPLGLHDILSAKSAAREPMSTACTPHLYHSLGPMLLWYPITIETWQ